MYRCKGMSKNSEKDARSAYFKLQFSRVLIGLIDVLHVFLCPNMLLKPSDLHNCSSSIYYWRTSWNVRVHTQRKNPQIHWKTPKSSYLQLRIEVHTLCLVAEEHKSVCWHLSLDTLDVDFEAMSWRMWIKPFSFIHIVFSDQARWRGHTQSNTPTASIDWPAIQSGIASIVKPASHIS